jgi:hypothetical protein
MIYLFCIEDLNFIIKQHLEPMFCNTKSKKVLLLCCSHGRDLCELLHSSLGNEYAMACSRGISSHRIHYGLHHLVPRFRTWDTLLQCLLCLHCVVFLLRNFMFVAANHSSVFCLCWLWFPAIQTMGSMWYIIGYNFGTFGMAGMCLLHSCNCM